MRNENGANDWRRVLLAEYKGEKASHELSSEEKIGKHKVCHKLGADTLRTR